MNKLIPTTTSRRKPGPIKLSSYDPRRISQPIPRAPLLTTPAVLTRNSLPSTNNVNARPTGSLGNTRTSNKNDIEVQKLVSELESANIRNNNLLKVIQELNHNKSESRQHLEDNERKYKVVKAELLESQQLRRQLEINISNQNKSLSDQSIKIRELTEEVERIRTDSRLLLDRYEADSDRNAIDIQNLHEVCRHLEAVGFGPAHNVARDQLKIEQLVKENLDLKELNKKSSDSLKYYKKQNEINKTKQMSNAFRYRQQRRQYIATVRKLFKNNKQGIDEFWKTLVVMGNRLRKTTKLKAKKNTEALVAANLAETAVTETGAKQLEETKTNERFACPHPGCGFSSETGGGLKIHMTVKHLDNDNTIVDTITLDDDSDVEMDV